MKQVRNIQEVQGDRIVARYPRYIYGTRIRDAYFEDTIQNAWIVPGDMVTEIDPLGMGYFKYDHADDYEILVTDGDATNLVYKASKHDEVYGRGHWSYESLILESVIIVTKPVRV